MADTCGSCRSPNVFAVGADNGCCVDCGETVPVFRAPEPEPVEDTEPDAEPEAEDSAPDEGDE